MLSSLGHNVSAVPSARSGFTFPHPPRPEQGTASESLVQFDHVTVGITQEQAPGLTAEVHRPSARLQSSCLQLFDRRVQVGAEQGEVGDACWFVGAVHEDVGLCSCRRIEDQIDFHTARVSEDRDWFRADRSGHQPEAEPGVEGGRSLHVVNADTDVGQTADAGECLWHAVVCSR